MIVQQPSTGLWYKGPFTWVKDPIQARDFQDTLQAFDFCANKNSPDLQIVVCSSDRGAPFVITPHE